MDFVERRKTERCRIDRRTRLYVRFWPAIIGTSYLLIGFWPVNFFGNNIDVFYNWASIATGLLGYLSACCWKRGWLRNVMASLALGRSFSVVITALFVEPPLPFGSIMRLTASGILAVFIFCLAVVEIPYLKAMVADGRR